MYAIACKFPDQNKFQTIDVQNGEQVNSWMYCTLFKTRDRAKEVLEQIKKLVKSDVQLKIIKYNH